MRHGAAISNPAPFLLSFCRLDLCRVRGRGKEKAARQADKSQYGDLGRTATGAGDWTGDGGQDLANAQIVWRLQERGRFAGDSRAGPKAAREDAQVFDRRETGGSKANDALGEVHSSRRKAFR